MIAYIDDPTSGVTIVGYADLQKDGLIDHFFCHHQYQGQGVGRTLMHEILHLAQHAQLSRLYSHVSLTAKPFFEHFGFRVVKKKAGQPTWNLAYKLPHGIHSQKVKLHYSFLYAFIQEPKPCPTSL